MTESLPVAAKMIEQRLGHSATIVVHPHATLGFVASGVTADGKAVAMQQLVDAICAKLRTRYELVE